MAVHSIQVTLGAGTNTQVSTTTIYFKQAFFQNNAANDMRVGGSETTTSLGALCPANGGSLGAGPVAILNGNLAEWYVAGTAAQVLDVVYMT